MTTCDRCGKPLCIDENGDVKHRDEGPTMTAAEYLLSEWHSLHCANGCAVCRSERPTLAAIGGGTNRRVD